MVQVHYGEGVANHTGPESCGCGREAVREALTGVRAGQVWSGESNVVRGADAVVAAEGNVPVHLPQNPHYCIEITCFFGF